MLTRSGPTRPAGAGDGVAFQAFGAAKDRFAAGGVSLGRHLGNLACISAGESLTAAAFSPPAVCSAASRFGIGQARIAHFAQGQLGGVAGNGFALECGGQRRRPLLASEQGGQQRPQIESVGGLNQQRGGHAAARSMSSETRAAMAATRAGVGWSGPARADQGIAAGRSAQRRQSVQGGSAHRVGRFVGRRPTPTAGAGAIRLARRRPPVPRRPAHLRRSPRATASTVPDRRRAEPCAREPP